MKNKIKCINHLCHALKLNTHSSAINRSQRKELKSYSGRRILNPLFLSPSECLSLFLFRFLAGHICVSAGFWEIATICFIFHVAAVASVWYVYVCENLPFCGFLKTTNRIFPCLAKLIRLFELLLKKRSQTKNIRRPVQKKTRIYVVSGFVVAVVWFAYKMQLQMVLFMDP